MVGGVALVGVGIGVDCDVGGGGGGRERERESEGSEGERNHAGLTASGDFRHRNTQRRDCGACASTLARAVAGPGAAPFTAPGFVLCALSGASRFARPVLIHGKEPGLQRLCATRPLVSMPGEDWARG